jgi:hypothetical protein
MLNRANRSGQRNSAVQGDFVFPSWLDPLPEPGAVFDLTCGFISLSHDVAEPGTETG